MMAAEFSYAALAEAERQGLAAALCTIIDTRGSVPRRAGSKMLVFVDGRQAGTIGGGELESRAVRAAQDALAQGAPSRLWIPLSAEPTAGQAEVFIEPLRPAPVLLVIGGGHVGRALVHLGRWLGFRVALSDDRPEFAAPESAPGADEYLPLSPADLVRSFPFHSETYIVMPTRGVPLDLEALPALLSRPHAYLGVIGSRRRWATTAQALLERGVPREQLERVHAPMGLELNAETPEEIAVSILAEIIMLRRGGTGLPMRWGGALDPADSP